MIASPINLYQNTACVILVILLTHTDFEYHRELADVMFRLADGLYTELRKGQQESFKRKILFKINYSVAIIMANTD